MRPNRKLNGLYEDFELRVRRLSAMFAAPPTEAPERDRLATYCAIEAGNAWESFMRSFYLSCVWSARTRTGAAVRMGAGRAFANEHSAIVACITATGGRVPTGPRIPPRSEPDWSAKSTILRAGRALSFSNLSSLQRGFSIPVGVYDKMRTVRNFYAHRSELTANKVENLCVTLGIAKTRRASELLFSKVPGRPHTIFEQWIAECRLIAFEICD